MFSIIFDWDDSARFLIFDVLVVLHVDVAFFCTVPFIYLSMQSYGINILIQKEKNYISILLPFLSFSLCIVHITHVVQIELK